MTGILSIQAAAKAVRGGFAHPSLELRPIQHGVGVVARAAIPRGTLILREEPLALTPIEQGGEPDGLVRDLRTRAAASRAIRRLVRLLWPRVMAFDAAEDDIPEHLDFVDKRRSAEVCAANATMRRNMDDLPFPLLRSVKNPRLSPEGAVLPFLRSLLNHSCRGNVSPYHRLDEDVVEVRTIEDVVEGEELEVEYLAGLSLMQGAEDRQAHIQRAWGFRCQCAECRAAQEDHRDVPPSTAWRQTMNMLMPRVQHGDAAVEEALVFLARKQRDRAGGGPSYAEYAAHSALAHLYAATGRPGDAMDSVARGLEVLEGRVSSHHPMLLPALLSRATRGGGSGSDGGMDLDRALEVHDVAFGGGVAHFRERYPGVAVAVGL